MQRAPTASLATFVRPDRSTRLAAVSSCQLQVQMSLLFNLFCIVPSIYLTQILSDVYTK